MEKNHRKPNERKLERKRMA